MAELSFAATARLPPARLRQLLSSASSTERVLAAWALGLSLQQRAAPHLVAALPHEPSSGVRRHLAVVLAGLGERAAVCALAEHDPDELVRATALRQLAHLARPEDAALYAILTHHVQTDTKAVRLACIEEVMPDAAPQLLGAIERLLGHPDAEIRAAVIERLEAGHGLARPLSVLVVEALATETDAALQQRIIQLILRGEGPLALGTILGDRRIAPRLAAIIERMVEQSAALPWSAVSALASHVPVSLRPVLAQLVAPGEEGAAREWLLAVFVEAEPAWRLNGSVYMHLVVQAQRSAFSNQTPLSPRELQLRDAILARYQARLKAAPVNAGRLDLDECAEETRWSLMAEKELLRLLGIEPERLDPAEENRPPVSSGNVPTFKLILPPEATTDPAPAAHRHSSELSDRPPEDTRPLVEEEEFDEEECDEEEFDEADCFLPDDLDYDDVDACIDWWLDREEKGRLREEAASCMLKVQRNWREFVRQLDIARKMRAAARRG